ncbi:MAG: hypothetical protein VKK98_01725 [Cyanobacteriota bacterium]|nr:hypothetical protein [Cyanobacteriota bacterium]
MIPRVLRATLAGALLGMGLALLLRILILNTPVQIPPQRFGWQLFTLSLAGGLAGLALSSVIALRASSSDPAYRRPRSNRRPPRP